MSASDARPFNLGELSRRIEHEREQQGIALAALSRQVGVAGSTIRRYGTADDAEADGVLALISWLGETPENFITDSVVAGTLLQPPGPGQIRVDMDLVRQATSKRSGTSTRTTIQRLAGAAQASGQTVASLTRWTAC